MSDNGQTQVIVTRDNQKRLVITRFPEPRQWVGYDPANAVQVAEAMAKEAYYLQTGQVVGANGAPSPMVEQLRQRLVTRVSLMIASMTREGRNSDVQAVQVVDAILKQIY